jgi:spoIIIJ-associated protein
MQTIIKEGKSTSHVISDFMKEHNLELIDFKFEVIEKGAKGFLGIIGFKPVKIRFQLPDIKEKIREYLEGLLKHIQADYQSIDIKFHDHKYQIAIKSNDPGYLIGKDAKMLDGLEHLLNQMLNKHQKKTLRLSLDVDGYRERKIVALVDKTKSICDKVKQSGRSITLEPMNSQQRRIVHKFVEKDEYLKTMTIGEGEQKRIVISSSFKQNTARANSESAKSKKRNSHRK